MRRILILTVLLLPVATPARAVIVGGGGGTATECLTVFDAPANYRPEKPSHVLCTDGDASCDGDGTVNGVCEFSVAVCANSTFDPRCLYTGVHSIVVDHAADDGDPKFDPDFQAVQARIDTQIPVDTTDPVCTAPTTIRVPITGPLGSICKRGTKKLRLRTTSTPPPASAPKIDKDKIKLMCEPAILVGGCDPQTLFTGGTFDRIQRQIFNPSCAIGGCHDSQSLAGGMTLEEGTAHASLVDVTPINAAAAAAGWKRVTTGDPATSFIFHKLSGSLPDTSYGERMPRGKPKLNQLLIDVIELWIAAGAPPTGWVPGTD